MQKFLLLVCLFETAVYAAGRNFEFPWKEFHRRLYNADGEAMFGHCTIFNSGTNVQNVQLRYLSGLNTDENELLSGSFPTNPNWQKPLSPKDVFTISWYRRYGGGAPAYGWNTVTFQNDLPRAVQIHVVEDRGAVQATCGVTYSYSITGVNAQQSWDVEVNGGRPF